MVPTGDHMILPMDRPQYIAAPEVFACGLAWNAYSARYEPPADGDRVLALMYEGPAKSSTTLEYRLTRPAGEAERNFARALEAQGIRASAAEQDRLAEAILDGLRGVMATRSQKQAASPISPSAALLCNPSGFSGNGQPPKVGNILDQIFSLGLSDPSDGRTASGLWRDAMEHVLSSDRLAAAIDPSLAASVMAGSPEPTGSPGDDAAAKANPWRGLMRHTPASWFAESWSTLTSPAWVAAMPPRVWADWATTVLRMAFGMTFLWEATWYEAIARRVQHDGPATWGQVRESMDVVLPWAPSSASTAIRDVGSRISRRAQRGAVIRDRLRDWIAEHGMGDEPIERVVEEMAADNGLGEALRSDLSSSSWPAKAKNRWEAIRFALRIREDSGPYADYYGLIRAAGGRWAVLDPGTEWVAVMASLSAGPPGHECDLGLVMADLDDLGLQPEVADIVALLEQAGLARGSADADLGVRVESAYR